MITAHQPSIFPDTVICAVSSLEDGDQRYGVDGSGVPDEQVYENRKHFLSRCGISLEQATPVSVTYDTTDFCRYRDLNDEEYSGDMRPGVKTSPQDAIVTTEPGRALFLPLGDCVGAVIYDPSRKILMVSHLGRHSIEQQGALRSINYLKERYHADPEKLLVWLSPAAGSTRYPLHAFDNRGMHEIVTQQLREAGVPLENIECRSIDTTTDGRYFSQSEFTKSRRDQNGRFAIVAMMK